jgi:hypothetical protein
MCTLVVADRVAFETPITSRQFQHTRLGMKALRLADCLHCAEGPIIRCSARSPASKRG